jgi:hypothetical protein
MPLKNIANFSKNLSLSVFAISVLSSGVAFASSIPKVRNDFTFGTEEHSKEADSRLILKAIYEDDVALGAKIIKDIDASKLNKDGVGLIHLASSLGSLKFIYLLVDNGAEINQRDFQGKTPLIYAVENNKIEAIAVLLDLGADINAEDITKETALWKAVKQENENIVKLLLNGGANAYAENNDGITPIYFAKRKRLDNILSLLKNTSTEIQANRRLPEENKKVISSLDESSAYQGQLGIIPPQPVFQPNSGISSGNDYANSNDGYGNENGFGQQFASVNTPPIQNLSQNTPQGYGYSQNYQQPMQPPMQERPKSIKIDLQKYQAKAPQDNFSYSNVKFDPTKPSAQTPRLTTPKTAEKTAQKTTEKTNLAIAVDKISSKESKKIIDSKNKELAKFSAIEKNNDLINLLNQKLEDRKKEVAFEIEKMEKEKNRILTEVEIAKDKKDRIYSKLGQIEYKLKDLANAKLKQILDEKVAEAQDRAKKTIEEAEAIGSKIKLDLSSDIEQAKKELNNINFAKQETYQELSGLKEKRESLSSELALAEKKNRQLKEKIAVLEKDLQTTGIILTQKLIDQKLGKETSNAEDFVLIETNGNLSTNSANSSLGGQRERILKAVIGNKPKNEGRGLVAEENRPALAEPSIKEDAKAAIEEIITEKPTIQAKQEAETPQTPEQQQFEAQEFSSPKNIPVEIGNAKTQDLNSSNYFGISSFLVEDNDYDVSADIVDGTLSLPERNNKKTEALSDAESANEGYYFPEQQ